MSGLAAFFKPVLDWAYRRPQLFPRAIDLLVWPVALALGAILKLVFSVAATGFELLIVCLVAMTLQMVLGWSIGLYRHRWRVASFDEVMALSAVWSIVTVVIVLGNYVARQGRITDLPTTAVSIGALTALVLFGAVRAVWRRYWEKNRRPSPENCQRTIVFGAGEGGAQMVKALSLIHI